MESDDPKRRTKAAAKAALLEVSRQSRPETRSIFAEDNLDAAEPIAKIVAVDADDVWRVFLKLEAPDSYVCVTVRDIADGLEVVKVERTGAISV